MDKIDREAKPQASDPSNPDPFHRRVFITELPDHANAHAAGERTREDVEYVAVPRQVIYHENVTEVPVKRQYHQFEPRWQVQHVKKRIPKEVVEYEDEITEVGHKRVIDEYVEVPYDAGTEVKCVPRVEVQERDIEVAVPRIKWVEREERVPEVREVVRYVEADHNVERVIRYVADSPGQTDGGRSPNIVRSPQRAQEGSRSPGGPQFIYTGKEVMSPAMMDRTHPPLESPLQGVVLPSAAHIDARTGLSNKTPVTVDIPVPFMVPRPLCMPVEVPLIRFRDNFVPIPGRRHVTPKLTFTDEVFDVPCAKEKPVLIVQDYLKPVPVDCHIRVKEKDVRVKPMDPSELSQADMYAMWLRANADLLDKYKHEHGGKYPRGYHGPEDKKVKLTDTAWEHVLAEEAKKAQEEGGHEEEEKEDLGCLPLHPGHPLMMTFLQNQWMQNPTNMTHAAYNSDFLKHHYSGLNAQLDPQCHQVTLTAEQMEKLGPAPHVQLPNPWKLVNNMHALHQEAGVPGRPL